MSDPTHHNCNYARRLLYPLFPHYPVSLRRFLRRRDSLLVRSLHLLWKSIKLLNVSINARGYWSKRLSAGLAGAGNGEVGNVEVAKSSETARS